LPTGKSAHLKLFLEAGCFVVCTLHRLLNAGVNVTRIPAGLHGAIAGLLELHHNVAQAALVALLLGTALLLCLACLLMHCVHGLAQFARNRSCLNRPLRFVRAFLDPVDALLDFTELHEILLAEN
jgi:hypothetical protein